MLVFAALSHSLAHMLAWRSASKGTHPDDDLRRLTEACPTLPEPIRAGILAMVEVAAKDNAR